MNTYTNAKSKVKSSTEAIRDVSHMFTLLKIYMSTCLVYTQRMRLLERGKERKEDNSDYLKEGK